MTFSNKNFKYCKCGTNWLRRRKRKLRPAYQTSCPSSKTSSSVWSMLLYVEKALATHSSALAWKIPRTEKPGGLQSIGSWRIRHNWTTSLSLLCIGEGNGNPLQCSCLENPRDGGAWWAAIYGVTQSRTQLKRLSSSTVFYVQISVDWGSWGGGFVSRC